MQFSKSILWTQKGRNAEKLSHILSSGDYQCVVFDKQILQYQGYIVYKKYVCFYCCQFHRCLADEVITDDHVQQFIDGNVHIPNKGKITFPNNNFPLNDNDVCIMLDLSYYPDNLASKIMIVIKEKIQQTQRSLLY